MQISRLHLPHARRAVIPLSGQTAPPSPPPPPFPAPAVCWNLAPGKTRTAKPVLLAAGAPLALRGTEHLVKQPGITTHCGSLFLSNRQSFVLRRSGPAAAPRCASLPIGFRAGARGSLPGQGQQGGSRPVPAPRAPRAPRAPSSHSVSVNTHEGGAPRGACAFRSRLAGLTDGSALALWRDQ